MLYYVSIYLTGWKEAQKAAELMRQLYVCSVHLSPSTQQHLDPVGTNLNGEYIG